MHHLTLLRRQLRAQRLAIPPSQRDAAAQTAVGRILRHPHYRRAQRIALYIGVRGELCPLPLAAPALARGKTVYLPVLHPFLPGRLWFCAWRPGEPLRRNRFGIEEPLPTARTLLPPRALDLVVVPLLGFDTQCHRLGMGGGFYDRTFSRRRRHPRIRRPFLLGFAHDLQRVDALAPQPWDIRLDAVVTERGLYPCA